MTPIAGCGPVSEGVFNYTGTHTAILGGFSGVGIHLVPSWSSAKDLVLFPHTKRLLMNTKCFSGWLNSLTNLELYLSLSTFWKPVPDLSFPAPGINAFLWIELLML